MSIRILAACAGLAAAAPAAAQSYLMIPDSTARRVMLFSPADGSLVNASFIVNAPGGTPYNFQFPKDAIQSNQEIWVSDQAADAIFRFDTGGVYLSTIGGGPAGQLDNIRGMAPGNGVVFVTNDGPGNAATPDSVATYDAATGGRIDTIIIPPPSSPFDAFVLAPGFMLISSSDADDLHLYTAATGIVSGWHTGAITFAQQITRRPSNGRIMVAGFSPPSGLYEYNDSGAQQSFTAFPGPRAFYELTNGRLLWTSSAAVNVYDPVTMNSVVVLATAGAQYINPLVVEPPTPTCVADCNRDHALNVNDFVCFQSLFAAGAAGADCNGDQTLNVNDFVCFQSAFAAGCSAP